MARGLLHKRHLDVTILMELPQLKHNPLFLKLLKRTFYAPAEGFLIDTAGSERISSRV